MSKAVRLSREEFEAIIKNYEAQGKDVTDLKRTLAETYPPKPVAKIPTVGVMRGEEPVIEYSEDVIECDRNHSLTELKARAKEAGLSTRGDKKILCTKLIEAGLLLSSPHGDSNGEDN